MRCRTEMLILYVVLICLVSGMSLAAVEITEVKLSSDPGQRQIKPFESLVIQVRAYGLVGSGDNLRTVRLQAGGATFGIKEKGGGWLSKPFRYQGEEEEEFYVSEEAGLGSILLGRATSDFVLQDSVLYTAPKQPGTYTIEAELKGKRDSIQIKVSERAASLRKRETVNFAKEKGTLSTYRALVEHYAPFVAQETWFQPKSDYLARFDYDGDWRGDNNWDRVNVGSSQAYVYYAVMETETHWFLIYNFFHPRDYSDKCIAGTCHENDNEGMILTIRKNGERFGEIQVMETLAHNNVYSFRRDRKVRKGVHDFDGDVELYKGSHPVVFIESGGHGVYGSRSSHAAFSLKRDRFGGGTGVTYVYKGQAERPRYSNDRGVGYELLPIYEEWWLRSQQGRAQSQKTFDDYYTYQPRGGRPGTPSAKIPGAFLGRKKGSNKAKPFWGWHDQRTRKKKVLATGQWGLDPAYSVSQNLRFPQPFAVDYLYNPYLGRGGITADGAAARAPVAGRDRPIPGKRKPRGIEAQRAPSKDGKPVEQSQTVSEPRLPGFSLKPVILTNRSWAGGMLSFKGFIDNDVILRFRQSQVTVQLLRGQPVRVESLAISGPLPQEKVAENLTLRKKHGRGTVTVLERPWSGNHYTAVIRIVDAKRGDDRYEFELKW